MEPIHLAMATFPYPETKMQLLGWLFRYFRNERPAGILANSAADKAYMDGRWYDFCERLGYYGTDIEVLSSTYITFQSMHDAAFSIMHFTPVETEPIVLPEVQPLQNIPRATFNARLPVRTPIPDNLLPVATATTEPVDGLVIGDGLKRVLIGGKLLSFHTI